MKATTTCMVLLVLGVACTWGCRKPSNPAGPPLTQSGYFPNTIGSSWVYEVYDSVAARRYDKTLRITDTLRLNGIQVSVWTICDSVRCDSMFISVRQDTVWRFFSRTDSSGEVFYVLPLVVGRTWSRPWGWDSVVSLETISVRGRVYNAYQVHGVWHEFNIYKQERRWFVPFVGMVQRQYRCFGFCYDNEMWELKEYSLP